MDVHVILKSRLGSRVRMSKYVEERSVSKQFSGTTQQSTAGSVKHNIAVSFNVQQLQQAAKGGNANLHVCTQIFEPKASAGGPARASTRSNNSSGSTARHVCLRKHLAENQGAPKFGLRRATVVALAVASQ